MIRNIAIAACATVCLVAYGAHADSKPTVTVCVPRGADYHDGAWFVEGRAVILQAAEDDPFTWCDA